MNARIPNKLSRFGLQGPLLAAGIFSLVLAGTTFLLLPRTGSRIAADPLADLPIDEAVPMLFRMGPDRREILTRLESGQDFRAALSRFSLGVGTDEPLPRLPRGRRVYVFHSKPWSKESVQYTLGMVQSWE